MKKEEDRLYQDVKYSLDQLQNAYLIGAHFSSQDSIICMEHLDELAALSKTYGFEVIAKNGVYLRKVDAGNYLGKGKLQELSDDANKKGADVIIFDDEISPNQQKNLEKLFSRPVIDRTELILEVFAKRAQTKEAQIQIELAKSRYQLPRLKRLWTHLSRQAGGGPGALGGEGERQIELDRRMIKNRITKLNRDLKAVKKQRDTQRHARLRSGIPTFAIVGYTNVGKSTLLNALTEADVLIEDKLFATLDTTTRKFSLPNHQPILLIDTVGFIRKIPHALVAAFKSTLEEASYTDILIHLIDTNHPLAEEHADATYQVLEELKIKDKPIITVCNKVDLCKNLNRVSKFRIKYPHTVAISATTREGFDELMQEMMDVLSSLREHMHLKIPQSHYELVSELLDRGNVLKTEYVDNDILLEVEVPKHLEHKVLQFKVE